MTGLFIFTSCEDKRYSNEQRKAFSTLKGNYHSYDAEQKKIFSVLSFIVSYAKPRKIADGKKVLFYAHGECFFSDSQYSIPDKGYIECYYRLSKEANAISFYYKGGANNKKLLRKYALLIEGREAFVLKEDNGRTLVFEKVK
jgi:hypothetical protein